MKLISYRGTMGRSCKLGSGDCPARSLMLLAKSRHQRDAFATPENVVATVNAASLILALVPTVELVRGYDALGRRKDGDCGLRRHHVRSSGRVFRPRASKTIVGSDVVPYGRTAARQVTGLCRTGKSPLPKMIENTGQSALL